MSENLESDGISFQGIHTILKRGKKNKQNQHVDGRGQLWGTFTSNYMFARLLNCPPHLNIPVQV